MRRRVPVAHLDVDHRCRFGYEAIAVGPSVVVENLEHQLPTVFHNPVPPTRLFALESRFEWHRVEKSATTESDIGQPRRAAVHNSKKQVIQRPLRTFGTPVGT